MNELRKVKFWLGQDELWPEMSEKEQNEMDELSRKRDGVFHCWTNVEEQSPESGNFREKKMALIEESSTGKMFYIDPMNLKFLNKEE